jgi:CubicO group peptidase (beta-lactamase class C family)
MTATIAGMMVEAGKLSWGSTIRDVFPDVASRLDPEFQKVTLSQLLTHRAGLPRDAPWWRLQGQTTTEQRFSLLTTMLVNPPRHPPGSTYEYSNVGYALAGLMAEQASEQSWETLMQRRLFEPLGMTTAGFGSPGHPGTVDQPWGHHSRDGHVEPTQRDNVPVVGPAASVHCSIPDWAKFAALHLAGARGKAKLLKASTFRALHTPRPNSEYAGGWLVVQRTWAGGLALTHNGSNAAWFATVWLAPARNFAVLVATNQGGKVAETATDEAVAALIRAIEFLV